MRPLYRGEDGDLRSFRALASSAKASHSTRAALAARAIDCGHCWPVGALMGRFDFGRRCDPRPRLSPRDQKSPAVASGALRFSSARAFCYRRAPLTTKSASRCPHPVQRNSRLSEGAPRLTFNSTRARGLCCPKKPSLRSQEKVASRLRLSAD